MKANGTNRTEGIKASFILDPTHDEMLEYLKSTSYGEEDGVNDEIEVAIYYFARDYHGGQWSNLYSAMSTSVYSPGMSDELGDDGMLDDLYRELVDKFAGGFYGDRTNKMQYFKVTLYQYEDMETDAELDPDYQLTDTLFDRENDGGYTYRDVVKLIRDYQAYHTSCSPATCSEHCWADSEPEYPNFGDGGLAYVSLFVYGSDGKIIPGELLTEMIQEAKS